jgi:DsbC/DsbD-like thiol-disulfide interchange protein
MRRRRWFALVVAVAAAPIGSQAAEGWGDGNARVQLVSNARLLQSGEPVLLGVQFDIRPGWHIYWKNPGGAGLATDVRWRLPPGVSAGDLIWPVPVGFTQSGDIPGYGYQGFVVLASELSGTNGPAGDTVVGASVSWLACRDVCVLGSAELASPWSDVTTFGDHSEWARSRPVPLEGSDAPFSLTVRGGLAEGRVGLWLQWRGTPRTVEWFPDPPDGLAVEHVSVQTRGGLTRIDANLRELSGSTVPHDSLSSVVAVTDSNQQRRGWNVAVDLIGSER